MHDLQPLDAPNLELVKLWREVVTRNNDHLSGSARQLLGLVSGIDPPTLAKVRGQLAGDGADQ